MSSPNHSAAWVAGSLFIIFILAFSMLALNVAAQSPTPGGSDRKPVPPPKEPPQSQPACPDDFTDRDCSFSAAGNHSNDVGQAEGIAKGICFPKYNNCVAKQAAEEAANKTKCEAVAGCRFKSTVSQSYCSVVECNGTGAPDIGPFTCEVSGWYDIEDYKCERPAPAPTPPSGGS
jgi:hypothetical protein